MASEVRFRDILSHASNSSILSDIIGQIIGKNELKLTLISKELPLPFDVVGLQLKFCDIVGFDENNNIYIIELKRKVNSKNVKSTVKQVEEYVDTFNESISHIKSENPLYYYHHVLIRYFEYVDLDYNRIKEVIPIIISIEEIDDDITNDCSINASFLDNNIRNILLKNFISKKTQFFKDRYKKLLNIDITFIMDYAIKKEDIETISWFPIVISKTNYRKSDLTSDNFSYKYEIVFENINNYKKIHVDITEHYESLLDPQFINKRQKFDNLIFKNFYNRNVDDFQEIISSNISNIPEIYNHKFKPQEIFQQVNYYFEKAKSLGKSLKFVIQIFRSGRTNPIIYLQLFDNIYLPLIQIKPVIVSIGSGVNSVITFDYKEKINEHKNSFYEDVILFDTGKYEIYSEESYGVRFYKIALKGTNNYYEFHAYSPKFRAIPELLPYMSPEKVKKHLDNIIKTEGETYLFRKNQKDDAEWITSKLNIKE